MRERQLAEAEEMRKIKAQFNADCPEKSPMHKMTNTLDKEPTQLEIELEEHLQAMPVSYAPRNLG